MSTKHPERNYLIQLLTAVIHDIETSNPPENLDWRKLYNVSVRHSVSNMCFYGIAKLSKEQQPPTEILKLFQNDYKKGIAREAIQHITLEQLQQTFEENQIACMPLKGSLIKYLYPQPDMRTMADLDILFKNEDSHRVKRLMLEMGFSREQEGTNHDVYYRPPVINIEMHRYLMSEQSPYSDYFIKVWDRANLQPGKNFIYQLSPEDNFIYLMAHLTKHYANAGTGVRSIMDIWLYNKRFESMMDWHYIESELEKIQLQMFSKNICGLSDVWFGGGEGNEVYDVLADYIFVSGVYGSQGNALLSGLNSSAQQARYLGLTKYNYLLKLFFPELKNMKNMFPILEKLPFLLPICWLLRAAKSILFKRQHTLETINRINSISNKDINRIQNTRSRVGLQKKA